MESVIIEIDNTIDVLVLSGATQVFSTLTTPSANLLVLIAGAALSLFAARCLFRRSIAFDDFLFFVARFALIYSLVSGGALWTSYVFPFISQYGEAVGSAILSGFTNSAFSTGGLVQSFATFMQVNLDAIFGAFEVISLGSVLDGSGVFLILAGLIALVAVIVLVGLAFSFILVSKVFLGILIATAPLFLVGMFLKSTSDIANGWVRGVSLLLVFQTLVYGALGVAMAASFNILRKVDDAVSGASTDNPADLAIELVTLSLVSSLSIVIVFMCPMIARAVGGANISFGENRIGAAATAGAAAAAGFIGAAISGGNKDAIGGASAAQESASTSTKSPDADYKQIDRERGRQTAARHSNAQR